MISLYIGSFFIGYYRVEWAGSKIIGLFVGLDLIVGIFFLKSLLCTENIVFFISCIYFKIFVLYM